MVKNLVSIFISLAFLIGISVYEIIYVENTFIVFEEQLKTLYDKTEAKTANREDALSVKLSWDKKKSIMHVWVPHNDVSSVDYWLNETVGLIGEENYELALPKIEVLLEICDKIPDSYFPSIENVF